MPKTPPESPAVFHYNPSPHLVWFRHSPYLMRLDWTIRMLPTKCLLMPWVEQVDYRLAKEPEQPATPMVVVTPADNVTCTPETRGHKRGRSIPSLEQITERFSNTQVSNERNAASEPRADFQSSPCVLGPAHDRDSRKTAPSDPSSCRLSAPHLLCQKRCLPFPMCLCATTLSQRRDVLCR